MQHPLVMTIIGPDRTGLVESVARAVADHGGNWLESRMCRLGGEFAGILRVEIPADKKSALLAALQKIPGLKIYGITNPARFQERCGTLAVRIANHTPLELAVKLGERGFFTWDGNYYALNLTEHLDVEKSGGFLRIGLVHYNTHDEVDRLLAALGEIVGI